MARHRPDATRVQSSGWHARTSATLNGVAGDWFADTRRIACDVARDYAPGLIGADPQGLSVAVRQPSGADDEAARCGPPWPARPGSNRTTSRSVHRRGCSPGRSPTGVPVRLQRPAPPSGPTATSCSAPKGICWSIRPWYTAKLVDRFAELGGLSHVLLSHRDDVADAHRYAERFTARVWIHEADADAAPYATDIVRGDDITVVAPGVRAIPRWPGTPGAAWSSSVTGATCSPAIHWPGTKGGADSTVWLGHLVLMDGPHRLHGPPGHLGPLRGYCPDTASGVTTTPPR